MEPIHITYTQFFIYLAIAGAVFGLLIGLIPFFLGRRRGERKYGTYGLISSFIGGAISPLLAIIAVIVFTILILRKGTDGSGSVSSDPDLS